MDLKCIICGREINGQYKYDSYGNCACSNHDVTTCFCCGRICNSKAIKLSPFHQVCVTCQEKRVEQDSAARMIPFIYRVYGSLGFRLPGYKVKLISLEEMCQRSSRGYDELPLGLAQKNGNEYTIYILHDLSRIKFVDVLAHEILHTWQWERRIFPPDIACEGFCNFGAFLVLKELMRIQPSDETDFALEILMKNPDKVYGDGFREIRDLYDRRGFKEVINVMKQWQIE